jgi:hypothetical protein
MLKAMLDFPRTMLLLPAHWAVWVGLLMATNFVAPLFFVTLPEGQVVLAAFMAAAMAQMVIFRRFGFVRLLGAAHFLWIPLVIWLGSRLEAAAPGSALRYWVVAVIVVDSLSLLIDVVDVVRFARGEREPVLVLGSPGRV